MDLDRATAQIEPRGAYEAIDFGFLLAKAHYRALVATALIVVAPPAIVLAIAFPGQLGWAGLFMWWLKPAWERTLLYTLSRALFGPRPRIREVLRAFPSYGFRDLPWALTWRRLSPTRSFDLPVTLLEGSTGAERSARLSVLHRGRFPSSSIATLFVLANVEGALVIALVGLIEFATPSAIDWSLVEWALGEDEGARSYFAEFAFFAGLLASVVIAPFYVGAGFSLYLHRRTELEAWDLEIAFRRLAARIDERSHPRVARSGAASVLLASVAFVATSLSFPATLRAEPPLEPDSARAAIESILESETFHQVERVRLPDFVLDWSLDDEDEDSEPLYSERWAEFISRLSEFLGTGFEILLVSLALLIVGWLAWRIARLPRENVSELAGKGGRGSRPTEIFGLEVEQQSLPTDLVAEARALAAGGEIRAALALLYRGALSRLILFHGVELARGVTERECVERARSVLSGQALAYLEGLTRTWLQCAYGHSDPSVDRLEALLAEWSLVFGEEAHRVD